MGDTQNVTAFRRRRKENLVKVLGSQCCLYGYDKCLGALEFHHIEPENKKYQLSNGNCHKIEDDLEEAKKCILVCSNCHREIHTTDIYKNINLWKYQIYNDDYANTLVHKEKEYKCSECGVPITKYSRSGLCSSCVQKRNRIVKNRPSREELKKLIREKSFVEIARMYDCTDNAVRKWCDKEYLPRRKKDIESYSDEEWKNI